MVMMLDLNAQTVIDLQEARGKVSFDLQIMRDYIFGDCFVTNEYLLRLTHLA